MSLNAFTCLAGYVDITEMAVPILDDVRVLGAVKLWHRAVRILPPEVGVGRIDEDREGVSK